MISLNFGLFKQGKSKVLSMITDVHDEHIITVLLI